ncbi:MAG: hypothetical protein EGS39_11315 [Bifidobacterium bifidum]|nr:hypothetical protein [Bifidobacterium bifidum]
MERSNGIMRLLVAATVAAILLLMSPSRAIAASGDDSSGAARNFTALTGASCLDDHRAVDMQLSPDSGTAFIFNDSASVCVVDTKSMTVRGTVKLPANVYLDGPEDHVFPGWLSSVFRA